MIHADHQDVVQECEAREDIPKRRTSEEFHECKSRKLEPRRTEPQGIGPRSAEKITVKYEQGRQELGSCSVSHRCGHPVGIADGYGENILKNMSRKKVCSVSIIFTAVTIAIFLFVMFCSFES